jgi:hypothetical protein
MQFTSRPNGWSGVFGSANNRPVEVATAKDIALRLKAVTQVVSTGQPEGTTAGNVRADEARRAREDQILNAIKGIAIDKAPGLKAQFAAFLTIGAGYDDALQYSLNAINRAAVQIHGEDNDAARDILLDAIGQLTLGHRAGGHTPPASQPIAPGAALRRPGA